jgi:prepilin signal peptidase PulO-like enzyme (type II secretory pathway)
MRHFPIRTLGRLLVIWGALLPLITLPSTAFGPYRIIPLLEVSLSRIDARIGPMTVAYEDIIVGALMLVGLGLSFMVMPSRKLRREGEGGQ